MFRHMTDSRSAFSVALRCRQEPAFRKAWFRISGFMDNPHSTTFVVDDAICRPSSLSQWYLAASQHTHIPTSKKGRLYIPSLEHVNSSLYIVLNTLKAVPITRFDHLQSTYDAHDCACHPCSRFPCVPEIFGEMRDLWRLIGIFFFVFPL